jgi:ammonia channel protein AmtB
MKNRTKRKLGIIIETVSIMLIGVILGMMLGYQICCLQYDIPLEEPIKHEQPK